MIDNLFKTLDEYVELFGSEPPLLLEVTLNALGRARADLRGLDSVIASGDLCEDMQGRIKGLIKESPDNPDPDGPSTAEQMAMHSAVSRSSSAHRKNLRRHAY